MFLMSRQNEIRRATGVMGRLRGENGAAMIAVIGIIGVTMVIGVTVTASTVNALGVTSATRAGTQARAAAEAGIDRALVDVQSACLTSYAATGEPTFEYAMAYRMPTGTMWVDGCPPDDAEYIKILSTGFASDPGTAGATSGDSVLLEAIYAYIPTYTEVPQFEPAVYAYSIAGTLQNLQLSTASASIQADIHIKHGSVLCSNGANVQGSILLGNGYANLNQCNVTGSIHASQYVYITGNSSTIGKGVFANGDVADANGNVVTVHRDGTVYADIHGEGNVLIEGKAKQSVTASGTGSKLTVNSAYAQVTKNAISSGIVEVKNNGSVLGTVSQNVGGIVDLPYPRIPEWKDIPYPSTTGTWDGYHVVQWSGSCSIGSNHTFWASLTQLSATNGNVLVDARAACGGAGLNFQNSIDWLLLSGNMTFIANQFYVDKIYAETADTYNHSMWFIVPDNVLDDQPTPSQYATSCDVYLTNEADFRPAIAAFVYTPCKVTSDRDKWRGQFYAGTMEFKQQATMTFVEVGVPGVDFDDSLPPVLNLNGSILGGRVSMRDITNGG